MVAMTDYLGDVVSGKLPRNYQILYQVSINISHILIVEFAVFHDAVSTFYAFISIESIFIGNRDP